MAIFVRAIIVLSLLWCGGLLLAVPPSDWMGYGEAYVIFGPPLLLFALCWVVGGFKERAKLRHLWLWL